MSAVDERVVKMEFQNDEFKRNAKDSEKALADVNRAMDNAGKGGKGIFGISDTMQKVGVKVSASTAIITTALATVTNRVVNAGINMVKGFTLDPIIAGFKQYELTLNSTQTILANTHKPLGVVTKALAQLNDYANRTVYDFGTMTDALGKFSADSGKLKSSKDIIIGLSNSAALSGANMGQLQSAFYQTSQAVAAGVFHLQDWNSVVNAGMGGKNMQNAILATAGSMGVLIAGNKKVATESHNTGKELEGQIAKLGGFRQSLQQGWLGADIFTKAMKVMGGTTNSWGKQMAYSVKQLKEMGYTTQAARMLHNLSQGAIDSAIKVRTFSQLMDNLKQSIATGWSGIFQAIFGDLNDSTKLWTNIGNVVGGVINTIFNATEKVLAEWRKLGGYQALWGGFGNIFKSIYNILSPLLALFHSAAPSTSSFGKTLADWSKGFYNATLALEKFTSGFKTFSPIVQFVASGIKALIGYLAQLAGSGIGKIVSLISSLFGGASVPSGGGILQYIKDVASAAYNAVKQINQLIDKGQSFTSAFSKVAGGFKLPDFSGIHLPNLGGIFGTKSNQKIITGDFGVPTGLLGNVSKLTTNMLGLNKATDQVEGHMFFNPNAKLDTSRFQQVSGQAQKSAGLLSGAASFMGNTLDAFGKKFKEFVHNFNFQDLVSSFNLAVVATTLISFSRFLNTLTSSFKGFVGVGSGIAEVLDGAKGALKSYQNSLRAKTLLDIAIAIGVLAASMLVLSLIPKDKAAAALTEMTALMLILMITMDAVTKAVTKLDGKGISVKLVAVSIAITALAASMVLLGIAFAIFDHVSWDGVTKGILVMVVLMKTVENLGATLKASAGQLIGGSAAIAAVAASMLVLAGALLLFGLVKWESIAKAGVALLGIGAAIGVLALIPYAGIEKVGAAMLAVSAAMVALSVALLLFAGVNVSSIVKLGVVLLELTVAMGALMFITKDPTAVPSMVAMSVAMIGLATAGLILNKVNWSSLLKIAAVMAVLVAGIAAVGVVLGVLALIGPALLIVGGAFALMGVGLLAMATALAIALPLLAAGGVAFAAFATAAVVAIGVFFQTLAAEAPSIAHSLLGILGVLLKTLEAAVPMIEQAAINIIVSFVKTLAKNIGKIVKAAADLFVKFVEALTKNIGRIVDVAVDFIVHFERGLAKNAGKLVSAGANLIEKLLNGLAKNIGGIVNAAVNFITKFINAIGSQAGRLAAAGAKAVINFINSVADTIRTQGPALGAAMGNLGTAMVEGLIGGVGAMAGKALGAIGDLASGMVKKAKSILKIFSPSRVFRDIGKFLVDGLTGGIQDNASSAITAVASMVSGQIAVASSYISSFIQDLDQQALAAKGKADGLAAAAKAAADAAKKTKGKADDKAAEKLQKAADKASREADKQQAKADAAKAAQDRADQFAQADTITKAQMRSEDAQNQLDASKAAEQRAAKDLAEANALQKQANAKGVSAQEKKALEKKAQQLREQAKKDAQEANNQLEAAKSSAAAALSYQTQAGAEAAAAFQAQFDADAKAAADAAAFDKLSDADKAEARRKQAADLQAKAQQDLDAAKVLAYTDLDQANQLAQQAYDEADQARQYLQDAQQYADQAAQGTGQATAALGGQVVNLTSSDLAASAMNAYSDLFNAGTAAAAAAPTVEYNQYITSPEALSPTEVYRNTNNLLSHRVGSLPTAA